MAMKGQCNSYNRKVPLINVKMKCCTFCANKAEVDPPRRLD